MSEIEDFNKKSTFGKICALFCPVCEDTLPDKDKKKKD